MHPLPTRKFSRCRRIIYLFIHQVLVYIYIYSFIRYIPIDFSVRNQVHDVRIQPFIAILTSPHDSTTVTLGGGMVRLLRAMIGWILSLIHI